MRFKWINSPYVYAAPTQKTPLLGEHEYWHYGPLETDEDVRTCLGGGSVYFPVVAKRYHPWVIATATQVEASIKRFADNMRQEMMALYDEAFACTGSLP